MKKMTNSEAQTFKQCRRKWWLAYYQRLGLPVREVAGARSLGTRIHAALSAYYSSDPRNPFVVLEQTITEDLTLVQDDPELTERVQKDADLARAMLEGYVEWLTETGVDQGLRIVADETKVEVPSAVEGVTLMGKLDLRLVREIDGARLFLDHKTVGSINDAVRLLHMDEQMKHYHLLEYLLALADGATSEEAITCDGGLYNMLRKVKRTARATPPFYERVEVRHNRETLRSYFLEVHGVIAEILKVETRLAQGEDPRHVCYPSPSKDCTWKCDFFAVCPMFDDGSNAQGFVEAHFVVHDPNERYNEDTTKEDA